MDLHQLSEQTEMVGKFEEIELTDRPDYWENVSR